MKIIYSIELLLINVSRLKVAITRTKLVLTVVYKFIIQKIKNKTKTKRLHADVQIT